MKVCSKLGGIALSWLIQASVPCAVNLCRYHQEMTQIQNKQVQKLIFSFCKWDCPLWDNRNKCMLSICIWSDVVVGKLGWFPPFTVLSLLSASTHGHAGPAEMKFQSSKLKCWVDAVFLNFCTVLNGFKVKAISNLLFLHPYGIIIYIYSYDPQSFNGSWLLLFFFHTD